MLTIRDEQMRVLSEDFRRRQSETRMVLRLREEYPEETEGVEPAELRAFVAAQISKAASYGIVEDDDVAVYVDRAAFYGEDWDLSLEWARDILNHEDWSGSDKISKLRRHEASEVEEVS